MMDLPTSIALRQKEFVHIAGDLKLLESGREKWKTKDKRFLWGVICFDSLLSKRAHLSFPEFVSEGNGVLISSWAESLSDISRSISSIATVVVSMSNLILVSAQWHYFYQNYFTANIKNILSWHLALIRTLLEAHQPDFLDVDCFLCWRSIKCTSCMAKSKHPKSVDNFTIEIVHVHVIISISDIFTSSINGKKVIIVWSISYLCSIMHIFSKRPRLKSIPFCFKRFAILLIFSSVINVTVTWFHVPFHDHLWRCTMHFDACLVLILRFRK